MLNNTISTYPSTIQVLPDRFKTKEMFDQADTFHSVGDGEFCDKVVLKIFDLCSDLC